MSNDERGRAMKLSVVHHTHGEDHIHVYACPDGAIPTEINNSPITVPSFESIIGEKYYDFEITEDFYHSLHRKARN